VGEGEAAAEVVAMLAGAVRSVSLHRGSAGLVLSDDAETPDGIVVAGSGRGRALAQAVQTATERCPGRPVVAVCERAGIGDVRSLLNAGALGVVLRDEAETTLVPTLVAAASGQVCVPGGHAEVTRRPVLSVRERQVVGLVALGMMNSEIAERLYLAESTVKSHLTSAFAKLGVRSRHEAVELLVNPQWGLGSGVLSLDPEADAI
jgi:DNA-binding NarL/FixJ family response regulator